MAGMYAGTERLQNAAFVPHMRVMADETLWNINQYMQRFHGFPYQRIGIDIFPLDYIPRDPELAKLQRVLLRKGLNILSSWEELERQNALRGAVEELEALCNVRIPWEKDAKNRIWRLLDAVCALYGEEDADELTNYPYWIDQDAYRLKKEWYQKVCDMPFENIGIRQKTTEYKVADAVSAFLRRQYDAGTGDQEAGDREKFFVRTECMHSAGELGNHGLLPLCVGPASGL